MRASLTSACGKKQYKPQYTLLSLLRMLFPVVNLPPFPNRFRVLPFLRKFLRVERRYLSSIQR